MYILKEKTKSTCVLDTGAMSRMSPNPRSPSQPLSHVLCYTVPCISLHFFLQQYVYSSIFSHVALPVFNLYVLGARLYLLSIVSEMHPRWFLSCKSLTFAAENFHCLSTIWFHCLQTGNVSIKKSTNLTPFWKFVCLFLHLWLLLRFALGFWQFFDDASVCMYMGMLSI